MDQVNQDALQGKAEGIIPQEEVNLAKGQKNNSCELNANLLIFHTIFRC